MAWIKIEHEIYNKPEVFSLASTLGITRAEVVGHLVNIWIWADQMSEDGNIYGNTSMVDELTKEGFSEALEAVGWLEKNDMVMHIPKFEKHNGNSAKKRAETALRVGAWRSRNKKSVTIKEKNKENNRKKENNTWEG